MATSPDRDQLLRAAAFNAVRVLTAVLGGELASAGPENGFRIRRRTRPAGQSTARHLQAAADAASALHQDGLSTLGRRVWYDDQRQVHRQIYEGDDAVDYAFMGDNPDAADNRWLREAMENRIPVIYFLGVSPGMYQAMCRPT